MLVCCWRSLYGFGLWVMGEVVGCSPICTQCVCMYGRGGIVAYLGTSKYGEIF